ncbi:hypothetical protein B0J18DRAFT_205445 [Chaetomium sp. MPI-SDFR-AT-0129]|nr:hypothetical protein B0J18DRAFT_205445 [Chaetomium sp. MPI-SDFR-AT-0129]
MSKRARAALLARSGGLCWSSDSCPVLVMLFSSCSPSILKLPSPTLHHQPTSRRCRRIRAGSPTPQPNQALSPHLQEEHVRERPRESQGSKSMLILEDDRCYCRSVARSPPHLENSPSSNCTALHRKPAHSYKGSIPTIAIPKPTSQKRFKPPTEGAAGCGMLPYATLPTHVWRFPLKREEKQGNESFLDSTYLHHIVLRTRSRSSRAGGAARTNKTRYKIEKKERKKPNERKRNYPSSDYRDARIVSYGLTNLESSRQTSTNISHHHHLATRSYILCRCPAATCGAPCVALFAVDSAESALPLQLGTFRPSRSSFPTFA